MKAADLRFLLALTTPLAPLVGYRIGDNFHAFWVFFLVIPVLDWLIGKRAARTGFDWVNAADVAAKVDEEIAELRAETMASAPNPARVADEIGDLLFAVAQLARHLKVDAEAALRGANARFERRFGHVERGLAAAGLAPGTATLDEMEALWREAKAKGL